MTKVEQVLSTDFSTHLDSRKIFSNQLASRRDTIISNQQSQVLKTPTVTIEKAQKIEESTNLNSVELN